MLFLLREKLLTYSSYISGKHFSIISAMNTLKWHLLEYVYQNWWCHTIPVQGVGTCLPDGDGLLGPSNHPGILLHRNVDTTPIGGVIVL